jgi:uncharacterized hydrophobic protein (TIGR00271 family)
LSETTETGTTPALRRLFNLRRDQASPETIDGDIRDGVKVGGTNLWVLMCAILIASIGLNVNSTAVIIGAMLISPLMGPIMGVGYGLGVQNTPLIRQSLRSLGVFVGISLTASTLYFVITPLSDVSSELLARTSPTIWDVLIAFFGGAAGMIGQTRKEPTTLIPGVAIATALMPPLCTAGYGLATGQVGFFFGAFYLFTINSVFIALATLGITRVLRLPLRAYADEGVRRRTRWVISATVLLTLLPSIYLAVELVRHEWFTSRAQRYVAALESNDRNLVVLDSNIDPRRRLIQITLLGGALTPELQGSLKARLPAFGLVDAMLEIRDPAASPAPAAAAPMAEAQRRMQVQLQEQAARLVALEARLAESPPEASELSRLGEEIHAQWPAAHRVQVLQAAGSTPAGRRLMVVLETSQGVPPGELTRLERWLAVRVPNTPIELVVGHKVGTVNMAAPGR